MIDRKTGMAVAIVLVATGLAACGSKTQPVAAHKTYEKTRLIGKGVSGMPIYEFRAKVVETPDCGRPSCYSLLSADGRKFDPFLLPDEFRKVDRELVIRATDRDQAETVLGESIHVIDITAYQAPVRDGKLAMKSDTLVQ